MCAQHVQAWSLPLLWNLRFNNSTLDMSSNFLLHFFTFLGQSSFQKCKKQLEILRRVIDWEGSQWRAGKWHVNVEGIHSPLIAHPCDDMPTAWQIGVWKTNHNWAFFYRYNFGSSLMIRYNQFTNKHLVSLFYLHSKSLPIDDSNYSDPCLKIVKVKSQILVSNSSSSWVTQNLLVTDLWYSFFLVHFEINLHLWVFQQAEIALDEAAYAFSTFLKAHYCKLISKWTQNRMITYTNKISLELCSITRIPLDDPLQS